MARGTGTRVSGRIRFRTETREKAADASRVGADVAAAHPGHRAHVHPASPVLGPDAHDHVVLEAEPEGPVRCLDASHLRRGFDDLPAESLRRRERAGERALRSDPQPGGLGGEQAPGTERCRGDASAESSAPTCAGVRDLITGWYVSYLSADSARGQPEAGPQERLGRTGDNLANVVQHLAEQHPAQLERIFEVLRARVPRIERVLAETMPDGRLLLQIKDASFSHSVLARFACDGTLKLLAYLVLLFDPAPSPFVGIEEPESFLHPRLLPELAEECRAATERTELLVTTHSPFFVNGLRPVAAGGLAADRRDRSG